MTEHEFGFGLILAILGLLVLKGALPFCLFHRCPKTDDRYGYCPKCSAAWGRFWHRLHQKCLKPEYREDDWLRSVIEDAHK